MLDFRKLLIAIVVSLATSTAFALEPGEPDALFQDKSVIEITITAPMKTLLGERPNDEYLRGTLSYTDAGGGVLDFDVGVSTRGNFRRQMRVCPFPPLRINFKKSQVRGTLFQKQNKP